MASPLTKAVSQGFWNPRAPIQNFGLAAGFYPDTASTYTRIWVSWRYLEPYGQSPNPFTDNTTINLPDWPPGVTPQGYIANIDAQVAYARNQGTRVMLVLWDYPSWTNGLVGQPEEDRARYMAKDRGPPPPAPPAPPPRLKPFAWKPPDVSAGLSSPWARILYLVAARYSPANQPTTVGSPQTSSRSATSRICSGGRR